MVICRQERPIYLNLPKLEVAGSRPVHRFGLAEAISALCKWILGGSEESAVRADAGVRG
jgi:hypothetical protein